MSYTKDRAYGERFIPLVRALVGPHMLEASPFEIDAKQAADLIVLHARSLTVGVRIRRPGYAELYPFEFTLRSRRNSGSRTELAKVCDGWMDWMFYGHGNDESDEPMLSLWMLIDMHVWRREGIFRGVEGLRLSKMVTSKSNHDGATHFKAFDIRRWPHDLLIAGSDELIGGAGSLMEAA